MATMKISEIPEEFGKKLGTHMKAYLGSVIPGLLDGEYAGEKGVFKLSLEKATFLNTEGSLNAYIFKDGNDAVFCIIPKIEDKTFAGYFPQMVPKSPWLTEPETKLGFPNLPAIKVTAIKWYYLYATQDESIDKLWKSIAATTGSDEGLLPKLRIVSREDKPVDDAEGWRGGLFYTGELPNIPEAKWFCKAVFIERQFYLILPCKYQYSTPKNRLTEMQLRHLIWVLYLARL